MTSVDLSKTYLKWGEDNMQLNNLYDPQKHSYVHADVKQYLDTLKPGSFDLVIMDPPTFSNSKRMVDFLDIQRDHVELLNKTLRAVVGLVGLFISVQTTGALCWKQDKIEASIYPGYYEGYDTV